MDDMDFFIIYFFILLAFSIISICYFMIKMILQGELVLARRFISFSFFRHYSETLDFLKFLTKVMLFFSNNF